MKNNIRELLDIKNMSINELSKQIEKDYATTHRLVSRDDLGTTALDTLVKVADALGLNVEMLYGNKNNEIEILKNIENGYLGGVAYHTRNKLEKKLEKEFLNRGMDCDIKIDYTLTLKEKVNDEMIIKMVYYNNDAEAYMKFKTDSHSFIFKSRFISKVSEILNNIKDLSEENILQGFNLSENQKIYHCTDLIDVKVMR